MKTRAACRFTLLGTPVVFTSPLPEIVERVRFCYAAAAPECDDAGEDAPGEDTAVRASVREGFCIEVDGRPARSESDPVEAVRALNHELMHALMLRRLELLYVHAGVVAAGDRAVVLPGLSRAGKSTLVVALLEAGARFLSDELLAYDPEAHRVVPFPRAPKVRDECVAWFPGLADRFAGRGEGRFLALDRDAVARKAVPALVVVPRWNDGGDHMQPLSPGAILLHLTRSALNFGSQKTRAIDHLARLAGGTAGHELAWTDPHAAAGLILDALGRARKPA